MRWVMVVAIGGSLSLTWACVKERCYDDSDCPADQVCGAAGRCVYQCVNDTDCGEGFECKAHRCVPGVAIELDSHDMVI